MMGEMGVPGEEGAFAAEVWRLPVFCEAKRERSSRGRLGQTAGCVRIFVMLSAFAVAGVPRSERSELWGFPWDGPFPPLAPHTRR